MKRGFLASLVGMVAGALLLGACASGAAQATGKAVFTVSDAAADMGAVTSIKITIDSVRVHADGGTWTAISSEAKTFDLLELDAKDISQLLAQAELKAGTYDQMELAISKVIVVDAEGEHEAKLPSNKLQLKGTLEVKADATATADFDFLADQSLHLTGEGRYILAPVIKLETTAEATTEIKADKEVKVRGGRKTHEGEIGMDLEGSVDAGLRVKPDAVLTVAASGKIIQTKGRALAVGTIKSVDTANGTVTIVTKSGTEVVLQVAADSALRVKGSSSSHADLARKAGAEVIVEYEAETKAVTTLEAEADVKTKEKVGSTVNLRGIVKAVDPAKGTVTLMTDSGAEIVLQVGPSSKLNLGGVLAGVGSQAGARVEVKYDARSRTVGALEAEEEAKASASGTVKAVDMAAGTLTLTTAEGTDLTLKLESKSHLEIDGAMTTLAALKGMVGAQVTVEYAEGSKVVGKLKAEARSDRGASVSGVIKGANPAEGTVTIVTPAGVEIVLNVTAASKVESEGAVASLVGLAAKAGSQVTVTYDGQTKTVTRLNVHGQSQAKGAVSGTLKAVDAAAGTITIAVSGGGELVLSVRSESRLRFEGAIVSLQDLSAKMGSEVSADYDVQTKTATNISVQARKESKLSVDGALLGVNVAARTLTIGTATGAVEVLVTGDATLELDGAVTTLEALASKIGAQVSVEFNADTRAVKRFSARTQAGASASISGTLKAVNVLAGTVTIAVPDGGELVLNITPSTKMQASGTVTAAATLATKIGSQVTVEYNMRTNVATSISV